MQVYTIPPGAPFLRDLAAGLHARTGGDPAALGDARVLLPTRRAVRGFKDAVREADPAREVILLPSVQAIGDVDEDDLLFDMGLDGEGLGEAALDLPKAAPALRRQAILAALIRGFMAERKGDVRMEGGANDAQLARFAAELGQFLDMVHTEEADLGRLSEIDVAGFAEHWQHTVAFLKIITEAWPGILSENGWMEPAVRRSALIDTLASRWQASPPRGQVIAAGSTGSIPATARLLRTIAGLPGGAVILPGLDLELDSQSWEALDESHPQFGLKQLLGALEVPREAVALWPWTEQTPARRARFAVLREALRPAGTTDLWQALSTAPPHEDAVAGLTRLDAPDEAGEARMIAVVMREALETPGRTAALVTPDRDLARRVRLDLARWGIGIDDSAGTPLRLSPPAAFLSEIADLWAEDFAPVPLLSVLKHPLCRLGLAPERYARLVARLEKSILRGPRPRAGIEGLLAALEAEGAQRRERYGDQAGGNQDIEAFLHSLAEAFAPLLELAPDADFSSRLKAHLAVAEALAQPAGALDGAARLWSGEAGEALADAVAELLEHGPALSGPYGYRVPDAAAYAALFNVLLSSKVIRPRFGRHPRLFIWGPLEARLQSADLLILGGLNEGVWPAEPAVEPWLSRPMRLQVGLSQPERRIGLAAHDFQQLASAPNVILTRAQKKEGSPQVPSRWLLRLQNILRASGETVARLLQADADIPAWAGALDRPLGPPVPCEPPRPMPRAEHRPKRLSVTRIETLIRDPYTIYAEQILKLRPLDPLDAAPGAAERGSLFHKILEEFVLAFPEDLPPHGEACEAMARLADPYFDALSVFPVEAQYWRARFDQAAQWFIEWERRYRAIGLRPGTEVRGTFDLFGDGRFTLSAEADRVDRLSSGDAAILDYKTGTPPSKKQVEIGLAPQLPLEAAILQAGGFEECPPLTPERLIYLHLKGGREGGAERVIAEDAAQTDHLASEALSGVRKLIAAFFDPDTPYLSRPRPQFQAKYGDYDHLARVKEWSVIDSEGGEG